MEEKKLKDICEFIVDCPHSTAKDEGSGYPLIRTPNVGKGRLNLQGVHRVNEKVYKTRIERATPSSGDIILAREAPVGNAAIIMPGQKVCLGQRVVLLRAKREIVNPMFLVYYLLSSEVQHKLKNNANGAVVAHLNMDEIRNLALTLPSIDIQDKIAEILSSIDDKIEVNRRINDNLEQQAQALFKSWFVDFEPFKDQPFVESELGMIPQGWRVEKLGALCNCVLGGTPSRNNPEYWNGDIAWINSGEVNNFRITKPSEYISEEGLKHSATKLLPKKTTVLAITGATLGQVSLLEIDSCANQSVIGVLENKNYPYSFIYPLINERIEELMSHMTGGAQQHINKNNVEGLEVIMPPQNVMELFNKKTMSLYELIGNYCIENDRLAELRDTLLPHLMSGELNVSDIII